MGHTHSGRHRRPGRTVKVISAAAGAGAITVVITASPAMAQTVGVTVPGSPPVLPSVKAVETSFTEVTVKRGDTLSGIAGEWCHDTADWTGWYNKNKHTIGANPDSIQPGQKLVPDCRREKVWLPHPAYRDVIRQAAYSTPVHHGGYHGTVAVTAMSAPRVTAVWSSALSPARVGGQSQVMNSAGHHGLFQFELRNVEYRGAGAVPTSGMRSVGEQQRVYENVYAAAELGRGLHRTGARSCAVAAGSSARTLASRQLPP